MLCRNCSKKLKAFDAASPWLAVAGVGDHRCSSQQNWRSDIEFKHFSTSPCNIMVSEPAHVLVGFKGKAGVGNLVASPLQDPGFRRESIWRLYSLVAEDCRHA